MQVRKNLGRLLWGHYEVDKSIFERLQTECSMLLGVLLGAWAGGGGGSPLDYSVQRCCEIDMKLGRIRSPPTLPIMYTPGFKAKFQQLS